MIYLLSVIQLHLCCLPTGPTPSTRSRPVSKPLRCLFMLTSTFSGHISLAGGADSPAYGRTPQQFGAAQDLSANEHPLANPCRQSMGAPDWPIPRSQHGLSQDRLRSEPRPFRKENIRRVGLAYVHAGMLLTVVLVRTVVLSFSSSFEITLVRHPWQTCKPLSRQILSGYGEV